MPPVRSRSSGRTDPPSSFAPERAPRPWRPPTRHCGASVSRRTPSGRPLPHGHPAATPLSRPSRGPWRPPSRAAAERTEWPSSGSVRPMWPRRRLPDTGCRPSSSSQGARHEHQASSGRLRHQARCHRRHRRADRKDPPRGRLGRCRTARQRRSGRPGLRRRRSRGLPLRRTLEQQGHALRGTQRGLAAAPAGVAVQQRPPRPLGRRTRGRAGRHRRPADAAHRSARAHDLRRQHHGPDPGFLAKALLHQGKGGDFRNPERIQSWAHHISAELAA